MRITVSLLACCTAAGVAVGALALDPIRREPSRPAPAAAPATTTPTTAAPTGRTNRRTTDTTTKAAAPVAAAAAMTIKGFRFESVSAAPGATVTVTNGDPAEHTVTAKDASFDSGQVPGNEQGSFVAPAAPGTYSFFCQIHPSMSGTLVVG